MPEAAGNLCFAHTQNRPQHLSGLSGSTVMRQSCADPLAPEEPDAFMTHVRVCGGAGWVTIGSTRKAYYLPLCRRFIFLMGDTLNPEVDVFLAESGVPRLPKPFTM